MNKQECMQSGVAQEVDVEDRTINEYPCFEASRCAYCGALGVRYCPLSGFQDHVLERLAALEVKDESDHALLQAWIITTKVMEARIRHLTLEVESLKHKHSFNLNHDVFGPMKKPCELHKPSIEWDEAIEAARKEWKAGRSKP